MKIGDLDRASGIKRDLLDIDAALVALGDGSDKAWLTATLNWFQCETEHGHAVYQGSPDFRVSLDPAAFVFFLKNERDRVVSALAALGVEA